MKFLGQTIKDSFKKQRNIQNGNKKLDQMNIKNSSNEQKIVQMKLWKNFKIDQMWG